MVAAGIGGKVEPRRHKGTKERQRESVAARDGGSFGQGGIGALIGGWKEWLSHGLKRRKSTRGTISPRDSPAITEVIADGLRAQWFRGEKKCAGGAAM